MTFTLEWHGDAVAEKISGRAFFGLEMAGQHLLQVSSFLVPIEEGDLMRSGETSSDGVDTVAVSYDRPYAVRQHEELTWRHDEGKQAKYLEQPMHTDRETMLAIIARESGLEVD